MFYKHRRRCFGALKPPSAFMQGLVRKTEKPTKKKQRKSNEEGMARDKPTSKKCRAMWQGASPPALRSLGPEATLTTSETVRSGRSVSDHTEVGPRPATPFSEGLLSFWHLTQRFSELGPWTTCLSGIADAGSQVPPHPPAPKNPGLGPVESAFSTSSWASIKHARA